MDNREWMYTGRLGKYEWTNEFVIKVDDFLKKSFDKGQYKALCPCSKCENTVYQPQLKMGKHICTNGFVANYTRWICHGEAHVREDPPKATAKTTDAPDDVHSASGSYNSCCEPLHNLTVSFQ
jgi:hypothetical protein